MFVLEMSCAGTFRCRTSRSSGPGLALLAPSAEASVGRLVRIPMLAGYYAERARKRMRFPNATDVHVERDNATCKFWLEPLAPDRNHGFGAPELNAIRRLINAHRPQILEVWHEHCGG